MQYWVNRKEEGSFVDNSVVSFALQCLFPSAVMEK